MSEVQRSYTTIEVAKRLGVSMQSVQRWVDAGHMKAWKTVGGHRRIDAESADRLFEARRLGMGAEPAADGEPVVQPAALRAVVVDDNPIDREILALLVRRALPLVDIEMAENGFQALVMIGRSAPGIVVTDIHMPHMDGFEMIRHLWAEPAIRPHTLVAVSAHTERDLASFGQLPPDVLFLSKPVDETRFLAALRQGR